MDAELADKILKKVEKDYDTIAKEWDASRAFPRPFQIKLLKKIRKNSKVLDVGCGNAVLYDFLAQKSIDYTGVDISARLLRIAMKKANRLKRNQKLNSLNFKFVKGNIIELPFENEEFDWVLALAVLHHLPGPYQKRAAAEIYRVLKPDGRAAVSVWNLYSDYAKERFKIKKQWQNRPAGWGQKDLTIPWKATAKKKINRFVYSFAKKEIADLFKRVGFKQIVIRYDTPAGQWTKSVRDSYNIVLTAQK